MNSPNYSVPSGYQQLGGADQYPPGQQVVGDNFLNPPSPAQQQITYSQMRKIANQRRLEQQQNLNLQGELEQALNPGENDQIAQNHEVLKKKLRRLRLDALTKIILALIMFVIATFSNEPCQIGWNAKKFIYIIAGLLTLEVFLSIIQIIYLRKQLDDSTWIILLKYLTLSTIVGFQIQGNVGYYNSRDNRDCDLLNTEAFILIIFGYLQMFRWCLWTLLLCCIAPLISYYAKKQQQPRWIKTGPQFIQNLYRVAFNAYARERNEQTGNNTGQDKQQCAICFLQYGENDQITPLPCDDAHFFHTGCIHNWMKTNNGCPMCRQPITPAAIEGQRKKILANQAAPM